MTRLPFYNSSQSDLLDGVRAHFQPIFSTERSGENYRLEGYEALGRKLSEGKIGTIWPYLDNINKAGLRPTLELMTLGDAFDLLSSLKNMNEPQKVLPFVSVNLHGVTLSEPDLADRINQITITNPQIRSFIRFEILEDAFPKDSAQVIKRNIDRLKNEGYKIYADDIIDDGDFDNDRLSFLRGSLNAIKFGKEFWDFKSEENAEKIVTKQIHASGATTVVFENIEDDHQIDFVTRMSRNLDHMGVSFFMQGWHKMLGKDVAPDVILKKASAGHEAVLKNT
jgi:EAL domain-containing protein (putative c-di-GMP-specific phosphodiesterase class I)